MTWFIHNAFGHPLMAVFQLFGMEEWAEWAHDVTLPGENE